MGLYIGETPIKRVDIGVVSNEVKLQEKIVTPTESKQTVTYDNGYDGLSKVTINKIPEDYIQTKDGTITSQDVVQGKIGYSKKERIVGNLVIQKYYTGSTTPSRSLGKNGDIYLQKEKRRSILNG